MQPNWTKYKTGGILKSQHGNKFLDTWQQLYDSKFGKVLRDFLHGKDRDLSDEDYSNKYGYNKPLGNLGVLGFLVAPEWEGLEMPEVTSMHYGFQGTPRGVSAVETERFVNVPKPVIEAPKSIAKVNPKPKVKTPSKALKQAFKEKTGFDFEVAPKEMQEREMAEWEKYVANLRARHRKNR